MHWLPPNIELEKAKIVMVQGGLLRREMPQGAEGIGFALTRDLKDAIHIDLLTGSHLGELVNGGKTFLGPCPKRVSRSSACNRRLTAG